MAEKRKQTYDLGAFQAWAATDAFKATGTAVRTAASLGFTASDMVRTIQTMSRKHFYKSMTSFADHRLWQDVYHVPSDVGLLYVKFSKGLVTEFLLLSFKEKDP